MPKQWLIALLAQIHNWHEVLCNQWSFEKWILHCLAKVAWQCKPKITLLVWWQWMVK